MIFYYYNTTITLMQYYERKNAILLGQRIRELRQKSNESLNFFVMNKGGLTTATWSRLENGKFDAKFSTLVKVAAMLEIEITELLSGIPFDYTLDE